MWSGLLERTNRNRATRILASERSKGVGALRDQLSSWLCKGEWPLRQAIYSLEGSEQAVLGDPQVQTQRTY